MTEKLNDMNKLLCTSIIILSILLAACAKKEIPGPQGEPGVPGANGKTNIVSTDLIPILASDWKVDSVAKSYSTTLTFPSITKEIVDRGSVKVFFQAEGAWSELPTLSGDTFVQFSFALGKVNIWINDMHGTMPEAPVNTSYRIVIFSAN